MTRKEAVALFLRRIKTAYIDDQRDKRIRASGRSAESLREEPEDTVGRLIGADYFHFQKVGRRPGGFPPIERIMDWLREKQGFNVAEDRGPGLRGLAFLIARKIARRGTDIYQGKRPGLSVEDKLLDARKELALNLAGIMKEEVVENVKNQKQKM